MHLHVNSLGGKTLGVLEFLEKNELKFTGSYDEQFYKFVKENLKCGIKQRREIFDDKKQKFILIEGPIKQTDSLFSLAFRDFLERNGYIVKEEYPEVKEEIKKLLTKIPDDNKDKQNILKRLPKMSHLEQTYLLEQLRVLINKTPS